jgi:hypothetical protein
MLQTHAACLQIVLPLSAIVAVAQAYAALWSNMLRHPNFSRMRSSASKSNVALHYNSFFQNFAVLCNMKYNLAIL